MPIREVTTCPDLRGVSESWLTVLESLHLIARDLGGIVLNGEPGTGKTALWEFAFAIRRCEHRYVWIDATQGRSFSEWTRAVRRNQPFFIHHWHLWPDGWMEKALVILRQRRNGKPWGASVVFAQAEEFRQWWDRWQMAHLFVYRVHIPPLRERPEDIPIIAQWVLEQTARQYGRSVRGFTVDAVERLRLHPWWDNVRELIEVVKQAVFRQTSGLLVELSTIQKAIRQAHYVTRTQAPDAHWEAFISRLIGYITEHPEITYRMKPWKFILQEVRRLTAQALMQLVHASEQDAARMLGVSVRSLRNYLKQRTPSNL